jgi:hypothetical protein
MNALQSRQDGLDELEYASSMMPRILALQSMREWSLLKSSRDSSRSTGPRLASNRSRIA